MESSVQAPTLGISRDAVVQLSERANEPAWLRELRLRAFETYERTPKPTLQDEEWRRTDIRKLNFDKFRVPQEPGSSYETLASTDYRSGFAQVVDGFVTNFELDQELRDRGVVLSSISDAATSHPELVQKYLGKLVPDGYSKFAALANALGGGVFLYVPTDVQVEFPIQLSYTLTGAGYAVFPRTLVIAERFANVTVIEQYSSADLDGDSLSVGNAEVFTGEAAQVRYVNVQEWGRNVWHFLTERHQLARDAQDNSLNIGLGSKLAKANVETVLAGQGGSCEMLGLYFADENQVFDFHTLQDHAAHSCTSDLLYKGVLRDTAHTVFSGLIRVAPGSQKTDAYQTNRNLLLSDNARADSIPNLEIEANDVKCSHGASIGPIDVEQLFYLQARGISRKDAERLIVDGFFEPLVNRIPLEGVRERLQAAIDEKMD